MAIIMEIIILIALLLIFWMMVRRWQSKRLLDKFPTVYWRPRFFSYAYGEDQKMPSSAITNILSRMYRLEGPYGCYATVYGISTPVIHIAHPIPARAILQDASSSPSSSTTRSKSSIACSTGAAKSPAYNHFHNFSGNGVFSSDGDEWRSKRASVLHCLMMRPGNRIEIEAQNAANKLVKKLLSTTEKIIDVVPILQQSTLSLIYRYLTGTDPDTEVDKYLIAVAHIRMILLAQSRSIWFLLPRWCYECFSLMYRQEEDAMMPIRSLAESALANAHLDSPLGQLPLQTTTHGAPNALRDDAITLLFAGHDTGAATLSWTLHLLSLYPDIQHRLAADILAAADQGDGAKVPLLDAVLKESMRLFPVAPFVIRNIQKDIILPEVTLPKGALACVWIYSLHRNPQIWQHHPNRFVPQRWLDGPTSLESSSFIPYAAGPRNCLGQPIAQVWLRILLRTMIHSVQFIDDRLGPNTNPEDLYHDMQAGFTVLPKGGVPLRIVPRINKSELTP
jgi:cytochrome P450